MTMKSIKASVGIAGVLALFACSSKSPGNPGTAGSAGEGTAGVSGQAGGGQSGSGGTPTGGTTGAAGTTGVAGGTGGNGAAGTTGAAGTGVAGGAGGAAGTPTTDDSVLQRGKDALRTGNYIQAALTTVAAMTKVGPDATFNTNATFTGDMYASPLYLANGPGGKGIFIASTTNNDVKAFDDTGTMVWIRSLTNPKAGAGVALGGGPRGIMGTPVIDSKAGADGSATIYVCAPAGPTPGAVMDRYELHALSAKDGTERAGWPAKLDGTIKSTNDGVTHTFTPGTEAQRPALSLVNGIVYIGFGGPFGDFSTYYGWVIAVDTTNPMTIGAWSTRGPGGAIWTPGGFASDGDGVIITTGNYWNNMGYMAPATYGDSEAIIRLSGTPSALARKDEYYPMRWPNMDQNDQDLGSSSVLLLNVPGATPANYAVTVSKDSHLYFANAAALGTPGGGGEVVDMQLTTTVTNHSARTSPVTYTTTDGAVHIAITVDRGPYTPANCPAAPAVDPNTSILMGLTVTPTPFKVTTNWCTNIGGPVAADGGTVRNRSASPLVTTIDGKGQPIVWVAGSMSQAQPPTGPANNTAANILYGVDGASGAVLYKGGNCAGIRQWTTPIAVKGHIVVGGHGQLCSWSPQP